MSAHQLTLRVPDALYRQIKAMARQRGMSMNHLAQKGLEALARDAFAQQMRRGYDIVGQDPDTDVEGFLPAQSSVVLDRRRQDGRRR